MAGLERCGEDDRSDGLERMTLDGLMIQGDLIAEEQARGGLILDEMALGGLTLHEPTLDGLAPHGWILDERIRGGHARWRALAIRSPHLTLLKES